MMVAYGNTLQLSPVHWRTDLQACPKKAELLRHRFVDETDRTDSDRFGPIRTDRWKTQQLIQLIQLIQHGMVGSLV